MSNRDRTKSLMGFTLLEIMLTVVFFTVGLIAILTLFSTANEGSVDAENTTIAMNLAQRRLEEIKNLDFDTGIVDEAKAAVTDFTLFQRKVTVTEPETDLKLIVVNVYWATKSGEQNIELRTYISKN